MYTQLSLFFLCASSGTAVARGNTSKAQEMLEQKYLPAGAIQVHGPGHMHFILQLADPGFQGSLLLLNLTRVLLS